MKIDRLLGITIHLLNHKKTSASVLADRFEVSVRTIQRDIESICLAGIPVVSTFGVDGGYEIMNTFQMQRQVGKENDYLQIITALQGYVSALDDGHADSVLEKMQTLAPAGKPNVVLDFSIAKEQTFICDRLSLLKTAIDGQKKVTFQYTNAENQTRTHEVEPVYTIYKWYAWYVVAYRKDKDDYAMYKLIRMDDLAVTGSAFSKAHDTQRVFDYVENRPDDRPYMHIEFLCGPAAKTMCIEYLKATIERENEDGTTLMCANVVQSEHFWYGTLLSMGCSIKVLHPQSLIDKIRKSSQDLLKLYS